MSFVPRRTYVPLRITTSATSQRSFMRYWRVAWLSLVLLSSFSAVSGSLPFRDASVVSQVLLVNGHTSRPDANADTQRPE